jgi:hypothetical protein
MVAFGGSGCGGGRTWVAVVGAGTAQVASASGMGADFSTHALPKSRSLLFL